MSKFGVVWSQNETVRLAKEWLLSPLVLKPLFGLASEGVLRVSNMAELVDFFSYQMHH
jgi:glutathione synthase/RimK-type ligase-like ATP-grasp enzyme